MISFEGAYVPVVGGRVGVVGANVGPAVPAVGEGEAAHFVHVIFECVEEPPFIRREVRKQLSFGEGFAADQTGVDASRERGDTPARNRGGDARGDPAEQDAYDFRKEQASVDEQRLRVRR